MRQDRKGKDGIGKEKGWKKGRNDEGNSKIIGVNNRVEVRSRVICTIKGGKEMTMKECMGNRVIRCL